MLPHHKDWACKRSMRRLAEMARKVRRGKLRWPAEKYDEWSDFSRLGGKLLGPLDHIDVRIVEMEAHADGEPTGKFEFRCLHCGGAEIGLPEDRAAEAMCNCAACGNEIGTFQIFEAALTFLLLDEFRYGEPEKFRPKPPT